MALFTAMKLLLSFSYAKQLPTELQVKSFHNTALLSYRSPEPLFSAVKRSRDPTVLGACDIVVDVGGVYDESKNLFDHHQRGFTEVFGHGFKTKLSSAGLVYK